MPENTLPVRVMDERIREFGLPTYGSAEAAGLDLRAMLPGADTYSPHMLMPGERRLFKVGVAVAMQPGYYGRIAPRSGLALKHGIDVMAGVVDSDYRDELGVILVNFGDQPFKIEHGDRIAQMVITKIEQFQPTEVAELPVSGRGVAGYGSTGVK